MQRVNWPKGASIEKLKTQVRDNSDAILNGRLVAIDPGTYFAGYAVYEQGRLVSSGQLAMSKRTSVNKRLWNLYDALSILTKAPDVLAVELLRGKMAHDFLKWSAGVAVAAVRAPIMIEVPIVVWKALCSDSYEKTDKNDAEMIGKSLIWLAKDTKTVL